ncbi:MAG: PorV/PorQ family protein [Bacteroidia bacterium]
MKRYPLIVVFMVLTGLVALGGNPDRAGGAGATSLLINPYSLSAGFGGINSAYVRGAEAFHLNMGGLAYTEGTEILFSHVNYLQGTGIGINNLSLAQSIGSSGNVIGFTVTKWDFGNVSNTTEAQPDGIGTFSPQIMNIGIGYSRIFSHSITGGIVLRYVSEGISNVMSVGACIDAGVQYQTSLNPKNTIKKEDFRFGISVRNIGPNMSYQGTGLTIKSYLTQSSPLPRSTQIPSDYYNLPSLVNIGVAYDFRLDDKGSNAYLHRLTTVGNFTYYAFASNNVGLGLEYAFRETFMIRAAYNWQDGIYTNNAYLTQYLGYSAGCSIKVPISKGGTALSVDYAYNPTRVFSGCHSIGIRVLVGNKKS